MENFRPRVFKERALTALSGNWKQAAIAGLVFLLIYGATAGLSQLIPVVPVLFVGAFFATGILFVFWDLLKEGKVDLDKLFEPFRDYLRYLVGFLLQTVYTVLWTLLLIVPGIIKSISYAMMPFIMRENPDMTGEQAICRSMQMMEGHKMDYFLLNLSFIGWALLAILTLGIGLIWLYPYMYTSYAAFYEEVKKDYETKHAAAA